MGTPKISLTLSFVILKDLVEIPDNIKEQLNIIPVDSIDQVIENALVQSPQKLSVLDASKLSPASDTSIPDEANISH